MISVLPHLEAAGHGMYGYARRFVGEIDDGSSYTVLAGGNNGARPNVFGSGSSASSVADLLRALPWEHYVTRADSAIDFEGLGVWKALSGHLNAFAERTGIKRSIAGDWLTPGAPAGRTLYLGSMKSSVFLRCYEKGKQLGDAVSDWVRVELVVRPQRDQRLAASSASPDELWGFAQWPRDLAPELMGGLIPEAVPAKRRESTDSTRKRFIRMIGQYRVIIAEMLTAMGPDALGMFILECLENEAWDVTSSLHDDLDARIPRMREARPSVSEEGVLWELIHG